MDYKLENKYYVYVLFHYKEKAKHGWKWSEDKSMCIILVLIMSI